MKKKMRTSDLVSLILNIITGVIIVFGVTFGIICIVKCAQGLKGLEDEEAISAVRTLWGGRLIPYSVLLQLFVGTGINLVAVILYVTNMGPSQRKNSIALFKVLYVFFPMILGAMVLLVFYWVCM